MGVAEGRIINAERLDCANGVGRSFDARADLLDRTVAVGEASLKVTYAIISGGEKPT